MRIKNGKIELASNEKRFGNYVLRLEERHMKVCDINETFVHKFSVETPSGLMLKLAFEEDAEGYILSFCAYLTFISSIIPDREYLQEVSEVGMRCLERKRDIYSPSAEEDDELVLKEEKELYEELHSEKGGIPS